MSKQHSANSSQYESATAESIQASLERIGFHPDTVGTLHKEEFDKKVKSLRKRHREDLLILLVFCLQKQQAYRNPDMSKKLNQFAMSVHGQLRQLDYGQESQAILVKHKLKLTQEAVFGLLGPAETFKPEVLPGKLQAITYPQWVNLDELLKVENEKSSFGQWLAKAYQITVQALKIELKKLFKEKSEDHHKLMILQNDMRKEIEGMIPKIEKRDEILKQFAKCHGDWIANPNENAQRLIEAEQRVQDYAKISAKFDLVNKKLSCLLDAKNLTTELESELKNIDAELKNIDEDKSALGSEMYYSLLNQSFDYRSFVFEEKDAFNSVRKKALEDRSPVRPVSLFEKYLPSCGVQPNSENLSCTVSKPTLTNVLARIAEVYGTTQYENLFMNNKLEIDSRYLNKEQQIKKELKRAFLNYCHDSSDDNVLELKSRCADFGKLIPGLNHQKRIARRLHSGERLSVGIFNIRADEKVDSLFAGVEMLFTDKLTDEQCGKANQLMKTAFHKAYNLTNVKDEDFSEWSNLYLIMAILVIIDEKHGELLKSHQAKFDNVLRPNLT